jgi:hypothetical protein
MKGVWHPSFIGESQHASATHVVDYAGTTHAQAVELLRGDIQRCGDWGKEITVLRFGCVCVCLWDRAVMRVDGMSKTCVCL